MHCDKCGKDFDDLNYCCPYCGKEFPKTNNLIKPVDDKITISKVFSNFFTKFITVNDVATIKEFIIIFIIHLIQNVVLGLLNLNSINTIINIIFFIPLVALMIRRYHDTNMFGFFVCLYGYALIAYSFSFFVSKESVKYFLLFSALATYFINFLLLLRKTNPNSRWNKLNGYM